MKILLSMGLILCAVFSKVQFTSATLQAMGLTCALCNNAVNKALLGVPFVKSVKVDIKNSTFDERVYHVTISGYSS